MSNTAIVPQPAVRRPKAQRGKAPKNKKKLWIATGLAVLLLLISGFWIIRSTAQKNIPTGVAVAGVQLDGMSVQEATTALEQPLAGYFADKKVEVTYGTYTATISLGDKYTADAAQTAKNAYLYSTKATLFGFRKRLPAPASIPMALTPRDNSVPLQTDLLRFAQQVEAENGFFQLSEDATTILVDLSKPGVLIDIDKTIQALTAQVAMENFAAVPAVIQTEITERDAALLARRVQHDPIDATIEVVDNKPVVQPEQPGIQIDENDLRAHLKNGDKIFTLAVTTTPAKVTVADLDTNFFSEVLGEQSSNYNPALAGRTQNVNLAAQAINGMVIAPGGTFSFNRAVGERSYARGFKDATVFSNGGMEDGVGGGICQVSSTLYCAQLKADLETMTRRNHMFAVSYVPAGQDATVAYGSIDYVFRNNKKAPIKLTATLNGGTLTIKILGSNREKGKSITIATQTLSTTPFQTEEKLDETLKPGESKQKQGGMVGQVVDTYKVYWENGVEVRREKIHTSTYSPLNQVILKGPPLPTASPLPNAHPATATPASTKAPAPTAAPTANPTAGPDDSQ